MPPTKTIKLTTNIADIPGVGAKRAVEFRRLDIRCVADLLRHMPLRYEHELPEQSIADAGESVGSAHGAEANLTVRGEIATIRFGYGRKPRVEATLEDGTGTIRLVWFNASWLRGKLHPGQRILATGKMTRWGDYLQIVNPKWQVADESNENQSQSERHRPIYPGSEDLTSAIIDRAIDAVLDAALPLIHDHLYETYRQQAAMPELREAYRMVHRPVDESDYSAGRRRLAFDELFLLQLGVMLKRHHRRETLHAVALTHNEAIDSHITARFPFELTESQCNVIEEIAADLSQTTPMNRLLQGDVGAGKTVVALYAMLMAVASRHQAVLMAPTELLAEQHYSSITNMLKGANVSIELLTGSLKAGPRRTLLKNLEAGKTDIVIGTHALLTESVKFKSLALVVIDEQHRFGVHQRATMRAKENDAKSTPHVLVMTATPIPRTLSLTVFGDLDNSVILELPPGRKPVITRVVESIKADEVYEYLAQRIRNHEQGFIVVPVIDESERGLTDLNSHLERLKNGALASFRIEAVHGRLKRDEREEIMDRFRDGKIDALVATTVIEVGVDVPNASMMIIEHANHFGLAQLHQLRGRVGRGAHQSLCVLIADPTTDDARARLDAIAATGDGFEIAEKDLEIRGPGELFGAKQSGMPPFLVAELPRDLELLRMARRDAAKWVKENPTLTGERDALLKKRLLKAHGEWLRLGDVA